MFQIDRFIKYGNELKANENARLVIWDSIEKKIYAEAQGLHAANYMRSTFLDIKNKIVYYGTNSSVCYIDFKDNSHIDILEKHSIKSKEKYEFGNSLYYVDYFTYANGNLFINIRTQTPSKTSSQSVYKIFRICNNNCTVIKQIQTFDSNQYIHILGAVDEKYLMYFYNGKYYNVDFDGNVLQAKPGKVGSLSAQLSHDGEKILFSRGKTPNDLILEDVESQSEIELCPGTPQSADKYGIHFKSFWIDHQKALAIIGFPSLGEQSDYSSIVMKKYEFKK